MSDSCRMCGREKCPGGEVAHREEFRCDGNPAKCHVSAEWSPCVVTIIDDRDRVTAALVATFLSGKVGGFEFTAKFLEAPLTDQIRAISIMAQQAYPARFQEVLDAIHNR